MAQLLQSRDPPVQTSGVVRDGEYDQLGFPFERSETFLRTSTTSVVELIEPTVSSGEELSKPSKAGLLLVDGPGEIGWH